MGEGLLHLIGGDLQERGDHLECVLGGDRGRVIRVGQESDVAEIQDGGQHAEDLSLNFAGKSHDRHGSLETLHGLRGVDVIKLGMNVTLFEVIVVLWTPEVQLLLLFLRQTG